MMMQMRTMVLEACGGTLPHMVLAPLLLPFSLVWLQNCLAVLNLSSVLQNASSLIFGQGIPRYKTPSTQMEASFSGSQTYCVLNSLIGKV